MLFSAMPTAIAVYQSALSFSEIAVAKIPAALAMQLIDAQPGEPIGKESHCSMEDER